MTANRRILTMATALSGLALLTACGGGGGTTVTGASQNPQHFQGKNDSVAARISGATTAEGATALTATAFGVNFEEDGKVTLAEREEISVKIYRTASGAVPTFEVTHGENTLTYGPEHAPDRRNYRVQSADGEDTGGLWTWAGYPIVHANGHYMNDDGDVGIKREKYLIPMGFWYETEAADPLRHAVIGLRTAADDMPTHEVTAFYEGQVRLRARQAENGRDRIELDSDLLLEASFADGRISGTIDNWRREVFRGRVKLSEDRLGGLVYVIPETDITGNGFAGTMVPGDDCQVCAEDIAATVNGGFYGPYAAEAGGTIRGTYTNEGVDHVISGVFYSNR